MQTNSVRTRNLKKLLDPKSVAVVGASENEKKPGGRVIQYLNERNYQGAIYPINPKAQTVQGNAAFKSLEDLPEIPDLVVVSVPAASVNSTILSCNALNVPAVIVFSSGFNEIGTEEGIALEAELKSSVQRDTIVCGPNCQGIVNFHTGCVANFSSVLAGASINTGSVGVVSQSGLFAALMVDSLKDKCGVGYVATTGNEIDVEFSDLVAVMAEDPKIDIIVGYLEAIRNIDRFKEAALLAKKNNKPLIILKVGKTEEAAKAAQSHTGALSSPAFLYESLFKSLDIIEVNDLEELTQAAYLFSLPLPKNNVTNLALLTNSGGLGVWCADQLGLYGFELAQLNQATKVDIQNNMFAFGSADNPVDIATLAITDMAATIRILDCLYNDPSVDVVFLILAFTHANSDVLAQALIRLAQEKRKPIIVCWVSSDPVARKMLEEHQLPVFESATEAFRALGHVKEYQINQLTATDIEPKRQELPQVTQELISNALTAGKTSIGEFEAMEILETLEVSVPRMVKVSKRGDVVQAFKQLGASVVMKVDAQNILHKSDVGGVILAIDTETKALEAYDQIMANVRKNCPNEVVDGVLMCQQVQGNAEIILGGIKDAVLGPYVMVGFGGIYAETLRDVVFRPAPVARREAGEMLRELKMFSLLTGLRGQDACDLTALEKIIVEVSRLIAYVDDLQEIDLNPVLVGNKPEETYAVDALMTFK